MIVKDLPPISCFSYMGGKAFAIVRPNRRTFREISGAALAC
jgi:hypothetical protein